MFSQKRMLRKLNKTKIIGEAVEYSLFAYNEQLFRDTIKYDCALNDQWIYEFKNIGVEKFLFVSIAGTNDLGDVMGDINLIPVYTKGIGFCHWGFLNGANNVYRYISPTVLNAVNNGYKVVFCGHSYGGAVAQILTEKFLNDYPDSEFLCVSFGSPRVWTRLSKVRSEHIRVHIDDDPVTMVPLILGLYTHKAKNNVEINTKGWFDIKDHSIQKYRQLIKGSADE